MAISNKKIYVPQPFLDKEEAGLVLKAVKEGYVSGTAGEYINNFEKSFANYCGCKYGISTTSGTAAIHLALATLGIGRGDEVLVSTFTNMATFFSAHYLGAKPISIDIEPDTWNINPDLLEEKVTPKTKAIVVVHIYGHPANMDAVLKVARKYNLFVVEDASQAHGAEYKGKKIGSVGDIGCFSFYANKIITTGEGGMVVTNNKKFAERAKELGSMAYGGKTRFEHSDIGFSYRMSNILAAIGCAQLEKIEKIIELKRAIADFYTHELLGIEGLQLPVEKNYAKNIFCMYHLVLNEHLSGQRSKIMKILSAFGIETRESFTPYNDQKILIQKKLARPYACPVASYVGQNGFYIPNYPSLKKSDQKFIINKLRSAVNAIKKI